MAKTERDLYSQVAPLLKSLSNIPNFPVLRKTQDGTTCPRCHGFYSFSDTGKADYVGFIGLDALPHPRILQIAIEVKSGGEMFNFDEIKPNQRVWLDEFDNTNQVNKLGAWILLFLGEHPPHLKVDAHWDDRGRNIDVGNRISPRQAFLMPWRHVKWIIGQTPKLHYGIYKGLRNKDEVIAGGFHLSNKDLFIVNSASVQIDFQGAYETALTWKAGAWHIPARHAIKLMEVL